MVQQPTPTLARPKLPKAVSVAVVFLPLFLLLLVPVAMRLWVASIGSSRHIDSHALTDPIVVNSALTFCRKIIGAEGHIVEISRTLSGKSLNPRRMVVCATNRGEYSMMLEPDGEVIAAGCDRTDSGRTDSGRLVDATTMTEKEAIGVAGKLLRALQQTPERITMRNANFKEVRRWDMLCRCQQHNHKIRSYRIQIDEATGCLTYFSCRIDIHVSK